MNALAQVLTGALLIFGVCMFAGLSVVIGLWSYGKVAAWVGEEEVD